MSPRADRFLAHITPSRIFRFSALMVVLALFATALAPSLAAALRPIIVLGPLAVDALTEFIRRRGHYYRGDQDGYQYRSPTASGGFAWRDVKAYTIHRRTWPHPDEVTVVTEAETHHVSGEPGVLLPGLKWLTGPDRVDETKESTKWVSPSGLLFGVVAMALAALQPGLSSLWPVAAIAVLTPRIVWGEDLRPRPEVLTDRDVSLTEPDANRWVWYLGALFIGTQEPIVGAGWACMALGVFGFPVFRRGLTGFGTLNASGEMRLQSDPRVWVLVPTPWFSDPRLSWFRSGRTIGVAWIYPVTTHKGPLVPSTYRNRPLVLLRGPREIEVGPDGVTQVQLDRLETGLGYVLETSVGTVQCGLGNPGAGPLERFLVAEGFVTAPRLHQAIATGEATELWAGGKPS